MRMIATILVAVALAAVASASLHIETVFEIPLPARGSIEFALDAIDGDRYYTVAKNGLSVIAVSLSTKSVQWWKNISTNSFDNIQGLVAADGIVLIGTIGKTHAYSFATGDKLWENTRTIQPTATYRSMGSKMYLLEGGKKYSGGYIVYNLTSGAILHRENVGAGDFSGDNLYLSTGMAKTLKAVNWKTNTTLWMTPGSIYSFLDVSTKYVVTTNHTSAGDTILNVYDAMDGHVVQKFEAMNGINLNAICTLQGDYIFAEVGEIDGRFVYLDILNGYQLWARSAPSEGGSAYVVTSSGIAQITQQLQLNLINISTGEPSLTVNGVPSSSNPSITDFGSGIVKVSNLQGYTIWDTATGHYLGRDERAPSSSQSGTVSSKPKMFGDIFVTTNGATVIGQKLAQ